MPSISYVEEHGPLDERPSSIKKVESSSHNDQVTPEPPARYDPQSNHSGNQGNENGGSERTEFESVRRFVVAAQIMALVSLIIGGVLLSGAAIVVAIIGWKRLRSHELQNDQEAIVWQALKRSATIAIVMSVLAFGANLAAFIYLYPMVMEMMQTGDYSTLFSGTPTTPADPGSNSSTWG